MKKQKKLNMRNLLANKKLTRLLLMMMMVPMIMATSCKKPVSCDYESNAYKDAKEVATSDSLTFVNYKTTASQQFLDMVYAYMNQGQTEEQAWASAINNALTNPNAPAEIKAWAEQYTNYLDVFDASVANRQNTYSAWQECEASK